MDIETISNLSEEVAKQREKDRISTDLVYKE